MYQRKERKDFLSMKEFEEGFRAWLSTRGWSLSIDWRDMEHKSCEHKPTGSWKLKGYGYYQAADWKYRYYASFRCPKCGIMVQFNQQEFFEDEQPTPITRMVIVP
jgi:hypothetical protein